MARFIRVTDSSTNDSVLINIDVVSTIEPLNGNACVRFNDDANFPIVTNEKFEDIAEQIIFSPFLGA